MFSRVRLPGLLGSDGGASGAPGKGARGGIRGYLGSVSALALCALAAFATSHTALFIAAFPVIVLASTARVGIGPAVLTAVVGVLIFDVIFVAPAFELTVPGFRDALTLAVMVAVAIVAIALAEQLHAKAALARKQADVERLRNALLSSLSHDLRTPLSALVQAGNALHEDRLDASERREFSRMVAEEATRLSRLVGNLLELTRLESGSLATKQGPEAIDEVIGASLVRLERQLADRKVMTDVPEAIPLVPFDPVLIEQVLVNLLENVIRHTPAGSPIDIRVAEDGRDVRVELADRGPGVPPGEEERIFDKLYRSPLARRGDGGIGLGLTICRAILTAHKGRIWLTNRPGGGAIVTLTLPIREGKTMVSSPSTAIREIES
jgi:two-component system sensor histidine kinase KdpD